MKKILLFLLLTLPVLLYAQYPTTGNKQRLGWQTTGDGLVYRDAGPPSYTPNSRNNAYIYLDTIAKRYYHFSSGAWRYLSAEKYIRLQDVTVGAAAVADSLITYDRLFYAADLTSGASSDKAVQLPIAGLDSTYAGRVVRLSVIDSSATYDYAITSSSPDGLLVGDTLATSYSVENGETAEFQLYVFDTIYQWRLIHTSRADSLILPDSLAYGTGTTNYLSRWIAPFTLGTAGISDDGSEIQFARPTVLYGVNTAASATYGTFGIDNTLGIERPTYYNGSAWVPWLAYSGGTNQYSYFSNSNTITSGTQLFRSATGVEIGDGNYFKLPSNSTVGSMLGSTAGRMEFNSTVGNISFRNAVGTYYIPGYDVLNTNSLVRHTSGGILTASNITEDGSSVYFRRNNNDVAFRLGAADGNWMTFYDIDGSTAVFKFAHSGKNLVNQTYEWGLYLAGNGGAFGVASMYGRSSDIYFGIPVLFRDSYVSIGSGQFIIYGNGAAQYIHRTISNLQTLVDLTPGSSFDIQSRLPGNTSPSSWAVSPFFRFWTNNGGGGQTPTSGAVQLDAKVNVGDNAVLQRRYALDVMDTDAIGVAYGTTAQRPTIVAATAPIRFNSDSTAYEGGYGVGDWRLFASRNWVRTNFAAAGSGYTGFTPAADAGTGSNVASGGTLSISGGFGVKTSVSSTTVTIEGDTSELATQYDVAQAELNAKDTLYTFDNIRLVKNDTIPLAIPGYKWTSRTSAADNNWRSVSYGNNTFVATGNSGTGNRVMTSPDGINWTSRTSAADNIWTSSVYGNGLFVAVAFDGTNRVMTSPDGINWTIRNASVNNNWADVTYAAGLFVAVAQSGTGNRVMTSPDGINWTTRTSAADLTWSAITYGNGLFVAVAQSGTGNRVMTSPDGINWTSRTSAADNSWIDVVYGNGLFVAVAFDGTNRVMTSPDGINWTARTLPSTATNLAIAYGEGWFIITSVSNVFYRSKDGINWNAVTPGANNDWRAITYGNGLFVAVAQSGTGNRVTTSGIQRVNTPRLDNIYHGGMTITGDGRYYNYGAGNKEASDLSKTQSGYIAEYATDGTLLEKSYADLEAQLVSVRTATYVITRTIVDGDGALPDSTVTVNGTFNAGYWRVPESMDGYTLTKASFGIFDKGDLATSGATYSFGITKCDVDNANCSNSSSVNFTPSSERELELSTSITLNANDILRVNYQPPQGCGGGCGTENVNGLVVTYTIQQN